MIFKPNYLVVYTKGFGFTVLTFQQSWKAIQYAKSINAGGYSASVYGLNSGDYTLLTEFDDKGVEEIGRRKAYVSPELDID